MEIGTRVDFLEVRLGAQQRHVEQTQQHKWAKQHANDDAKPRILPTTTATQWFQQPARQWVEHERSSSKVKCASSISFFLAGLTQTG